jgi:hypothetical protein
MQQHLGTYMEVCEEIHDEEIANHERRKDEYHDSRKEKSGAQFRAQLAPLVGSQKLLVDLASLVKDKIENRELKCPLECTGKKLVVLRKR